MVIPKGIKPQHHVKVIPCCGIYNRWHRWHRWHRWRKTQDNLPLRPTLLMRAHLAQEDLPCPQRPTLHKKTYLATINIKITRKAKIKKKG